PSNPARFSGTVIVEPLMPARRFDWPMMWGFSPEQISDRDDAWVGVTPPANADGLKKFNPSRYAAVSFANPTPGAPCGNAVAPANEEGLRWDMLSQVGALLKSNVPGRPLAGSRVQYLFMTAQGADVATYANVVHGTLDNG